MNMNKFMEVAVAGLLGVLTLVYLGLALIVLKVVWLGLMA